MYRPSGNAVAAISARSSAICNHPVQVILSGFQRSSGRISAQRR
jgi:hypothetical protein